MMLRRQAEGREREREKFYPLSSAWDGGNV
jgi:hypothetical protein